MRRVVDEMLTVATRRRIGMLAEGCDGDREGRA
jgi:hypothetical protein